jgi:hypothetical protein
MTSQSTMTQFNQLAKACMNHSVNANKRPGWPSRSLRIPLCWVALALVFLVAGCNTITRIDQPTEVQTQLLEEGQTTGQSCTARFGGLESVHFFLKPGTPGDGQIIFHLRSNSYIQSNQGSAVQADLRKAILPVNAITSASFYKFDFSALRNSQFQDYYAYLEIEGEGQILVASGPPDSYLDGAFYQAHQPVEAQAAFHLGYDAGLLAAGLLRMVLFWVGILLAGAFLFLLPGWGLWSALYPSWGDISWPGKLGLAAGASLSLYPVLLLWTDLVGIRPGGLLAWLPPLVGFGLLLWQNRSRLSTFREGQVGYRFKRQSNGRIQFGLIHKNFPWPHLTFLVVAVLVILTRFWPVRSLEVPMLGDSYQHTMITQLLLDNGGLFDSWQPYSDLNTFTYHFGFHAAAAAFAWLSHLPAAQAVLWTGQLLNILAVLSLYPLAAKIGRNPWAGVAAVLLAGLLVPMPMSYTNWGRYTQLAGQVVLPVVVYLLWTLLERKQEGKTVYILIWIMLAGIALLHYRVLIFALLSLPVLIVFQVRERRLHDLLREVLYLGVGALTLFLPWFMHVYGGAIMRIFTANLSTPAGQLSEATQQYNAIGDLSAYLPTLVWLLLPLALAWGVLNRHKAGVIASLWWGLVVLAANPHWVGLPGTGSISNFAIAIAAYIPAGLLLGGATGWLMNGMEGHPVVDRKRIGWLSNQGVRQALLFCLALVLAFFGIRQTISYVNVPTHALVTRPDLRAAAWIQENIPQETCFLVNSFLAYSGSVVVGSDAGWWLPLLAQRQTTLPPLSYGLEVEPWPGYRKYVRELTTIIEEQGILHPDSMAALQQRGVSHVYIGQQQGRVNYSGPAILNPNQLLSSERFQLVYHQDRVWIFEFLQ